MLRPDVREPRGRPSAPLERTRRTRTSSLPSPSCEPEPFDFPFGEVAARCGERTGPSPAAGQWSRTGRRIRHRRNPWSRSASDEAVALALVDGSVAVGSVAVGRSRVGSEVVDGVVRRGIGLPATTASAWVDGMPDARPAVTVVSSVTRRCRGRTSRSSSVATGGVDDRFGCPVALGCVGASFGRRPVGAFGRLCHQLLRSHMRTSTMGSRRENLFMLDDRARRRPCERGQAQRATSSGRRQSSRSRCTRERRPRIHELRFFFFMRLGDSPRSTPPPRTRVRQVPTASDPPPFRAPPSRARKS